MVFVRIIHGKIRLDVKMMTIALNRAMLAKIAFRGMFLDYFLISITCNLSQSRFMSSNKDEELLEMTKFGQADVSGKDFIESHLVQTCCR